MKETIQNLARMFKAKLLLGLFVFLVLFIPLFVFAQPDTTTNNSLPTEESFIKMWEKKMKNDNETVTFEKIEEGKYHFKTNKFLFDDELKVVSVEIEKNISKGCASRYTSANINLKLTGVPDISEFRSKYEYQENQNVINYLNWYSSSAYLYYDHQAERWLSKGKYNNQERECRNQIFSGNQLDETYLYSLFILEIFNKFVLLALGLVFLCVLIKIYWHCRNKKKLTINEIIFFALFIWILLFFYKIFNHDLCYDPVVFSDLYYPFSSSVVENNLWISSIVFYGKTILELIIIFLFVRKYIDQKRKKKAILKIFIPIAIVLNPLAMFIFMWLISLYLDFCADFLPIKNSIEVYFFVKFFFCFLLSVVVFKFVIICRIFEKAGKKGLLTKLSSKTNTLKIVIFASLLSFAFGFVINFAYNECDHNYLLDRESGGYVLNSPTHCSYMPFIKERFEEIERIENKKRIEECERIRGLSDDQLYDCYVKYAIKKSDYKLCDFAGKKEDLESAVNYDYYKKEWWYLCCKDIAVETLDERICKRIVYQKDLSCEKQEESLIFRCYYEIAIKKEDYDICDKIKDPFDRCELSVKNIREKCYIELDNISESGK